MKWIRAAQRHKVLAASVVLIGLVGGADAPAVNQPGAPLEQGPPPVYWKTAVCRDCHFKIYSESAGSMHEKSYTNPVFQAQYYREVLHGSKTDPLLKEEARGCAACHMPVAYLRNEWLVGAVELSEPENSGVTCDFCHTITGYKGTVPGNGNYISAPGDKKYGPLRTADNHHAEEAPFFAVSEFCAMCHNAFNAHGVEVKATYSEWKESAYAENNIQCQDCHMNKSGYLTEGGAVFDIGRAAEATLVDLSDRPGEELHTHRFPGAHDNSQMLAALKLVIRGERQSEDELSVEVVVDNSKTGHKMPTGSSELRLVWLELEALFGASAIPVPAVSRESTGLDVSGLSPFDREGLGGDVPAGARVYRSVFADKEGKQTQYSYRAAKIIFDNRLKPAERRSERYRFKIPEGDAGAVVLNAKLYYLRYPGSFARRIGVPPAEPVRLAAESRTIRLREKPAGDAR